MIIMSSSYGPNMAVAGIHMATYDRVFLKYFYLLVTTTFFPLVDFLIRLTYHIGYVDFF